MQDFLYKVASDILLLSFFLRRGSVVAIFNLTFSRDIADDLGDNVTNNLVVAVKTGSLGGLAVDPDSLNVTKVGAYAFSFCCIPNSKLNRGSL